MTKVFLYLLAPHIPHNFAVLSQAIIDFPDLIAEQQIRMAFPKMQGDVIRQDGGLMLPKSDEPYIYVKADRAELDPSILDQIIDVQVFTIDTQPFETFWLNV